MKIILDYETVSSNASSYPQKTNRYPRDGFQALSIKAAAMGTNLKKYIEDLLVREMEDMDDAEVYKYLVSKKPEGKVMISETEQVEFEAWIDAHRL